MWKQNVKENFVFLFFSSPFWFPHLVLFLFLFCFSIVSEFPCMIPGNECPSLPYISRYLYFSSLFVKIIFFHNNILKFLYLLLFTALDFTQNKITGVFERGLPQNAGNVCVLTMSDETFTLLTYHRFTLEDAISMGKVQQSGDPSIPSKLSILFKTPTSRVRL